MRPVQWGTMNPHMLTGHVKTAQIEWKPLVESGVDTKGIFVKTLRIDPVSGRAPSFLLRFDPGASARTAPAASNSAAKPARAALGRRHFQDDRPRSALVEDMLHLVSDQCPLPMPISRTVEASVRHRWPLGRSAFSRRRTGRAIAPRAESALISHGLGPREPRCRRGTLSTARGSR
jgi:hypothetical protein